MMQLIFTCDRWGREWGKRHRGTVFEYDFCFLGETCLLDLNSVASYLNSVYLAIFLININLRNFST